MPRRTQLIFAARGRRRSYIFCGSVVCFILMHYISKSSLFHHTPSSSIPRTQPFKFTSAALPPALALHTPTITTVFYHPPLATQIPSEYADALPLILGSPLAPPYTLTRLSGNPILIFPSSLASALSHLTSSPGPSCRSQSDIASRFPPSQHNIFLALNLYNAEGVLPAFIMQLPVVLSLLGPQRFFVSILENGSKDNTPRLLRLLAISLDSLGTPYSVTSLGSTEPFEPTGPNVGSSSLRESETQFFSLCMTARLSRLCPERDLIKFCL
jgi:hypothetical protein